MKRLAALVLVGLAFVATHPAAGQQAAPRITGSAKLKAQAKVGEDSARAVALAQVPNGTIQSGELEREHGKLIYSFDIKVQGRSGIEEVNVDALTGAVVAHEHESPAAERAEARKEARERKPATKPRPTRTRGAATGDTTGRPKVP